MKLEGADIIHNSTGDLKFFRRLATETFIEKYFELIHNYLKKFNIESFLADPCYDENVEAIMLNIGGYNMKLFRNNQIIFDKNAMSTEDLEKATLNMPAVVSFNNLEDLVKHFEKHNLILWKNKKLRHLVDVGTLESLRYPNRVEDGSINKFREEARQEFLRAFVDMISEDFKKYNFVAELEEETKDYDKCIYVNGIPMLFNLSSGGLKFYLKKIQETQPELYNHLTSNVIKGRTSGPEFMFVKDIVDYFKEHGLSIYTNEKTKKIVKLGVFENETTSKEFNLTFLDYYNLVNRKKKDWYKELILKDLKENGYEITNADYDKDDDNILSLNIDSIPMYIRNNQLQFDYNEVEINFPELFKLIRKNNPTFGRVISFTRYLEENRINLKYYASKKLTSLNKNIGVFENQNPTAEELHKHYTKNGQIEMYWDNAMVERDDYFIRTLTAKFEECGLVLNFVKKKPRDREFFFTIKSTAFNREIPIKIDEINIKYNFSSEYNFSDHSHVNFMLHVFKSVTEFAEHFHINFNKKLKKMKHLGVFEKIDIENFKGFPEINKIPHRKENDVSYLLANAKRAGEIYYVNSVIDEFKKHSISCVFDKMSDRDYFFTLDNKVQIKIDTVDISYEGNDSLNIAFLSFYDVDSCAQDFLIRFNKKLKPLKKHGILEFKEFNK